LAWLAGAKKLKGGQHLGKTPLIQRKDFSTIMEFLNQFAALSMDTHSEPSTTPPYPPVRGTTPPAEKLQNAAMIAKIWEIDDKMKNTRFRNWKNDAEDTGFSSLIGRKTSQQQQQQQQQEASHSFPSAFSTGSSRPSVKFERSKPKIINTSSNIEFPSLGSAKSKTTGAWASSSSSSKTKSFASTVSEMAERERIENEEQMMAEQVEKHRRHMEMISTMPIANRFRRRLEDILVEEQDDEYNRCDDNAFPDDVYEPTIEMDVPNDYSGVEADQ